MFHEISAQLRHRADLLLQGRIDELVTSYHCPLPLELGDRRLIVCTVEEGLAMLSLLRAALLSRGVVALRPTVVALDLPRNGRFRAWVDWQEVALSAQETRTSSSVHYCRITPSGPVTEMLCYTRLSMPELNPQFAELALSA
ncbi:MAG: hypothetical protein NTW20_07750 [Rhodobacterales bacterium]|nr:hypothetical protein [Rhodobacterales bacterium]